MRYLSAHPRSEQIAFSLNNSVREPVRPTRTFDAEPNVPSRLYADGKKCVGGAGNS